MAKGPRCTGIVIQVGTYDVKHASARRMARRTVNRRLRGAWRIESLSKACRDFRVVRRIGRPIATGQAWDLAAKLARDRNVACAEPSFRIQGVEPDPEDPAGGLAKHEGRPLAKSWGAGGHAGCSADPLWSLELIKAREAWAMPPKPGGKRYGRGSVVGHPDTGYTRHDEIWNPSAGQNRILWKKGYDFYANRKDPRDPLEGMNPGHGTSTASVIMSGHDPGAPDEPTVSGVAPETKLIPFRVSHKVAHIDFANVAEAIYEAVEQGAQVISMSLGGPAGSGFLERSIDHALSRGVIVLAAAGNIWPFVVYPARYDQVIAVAAVGCGKKPWRHSARGKDVDLAAPGESVWRAETEEGPVFRISRSAGTSYAVAHTAGAAALWLAHHGRNRLIGRYGLPNVPAVFRELLVEHGYQRPSGWKTKKYGVGILRADRLLAAPLPESAPAAGIVPKALRKARRRPDPVAEIAGYLPEGDRKRLRGALGRLLGIPDEELDDALDEHGDELVFHVATSPTLRGKLHGACGPLPKSKRAPSPRRGLSRDARLKRGASRAMRGMLGL